MSDYQVYKNLCKPGYINHQHRLGNFCQPVDNNKKQIVAHVLPIGRHRQFRLSQDLYEPADNDKNQIINSILSIDMAIRHKSINKSFQ